MEQIKNQPRGEQETAMQALLWVVHARTPLYESELRHALAVEPGEHALDEMNMQDTVDILSCCGGPLRQEPKTGLVRLAHPSIHRYFTLPKEDMLRLPRCFGPTEPVNRTGIQKVHQH